MKCEFSQTQQKFWLKKLMEILKKSVKVFLKKSKFDDRISRQSVQFYKKFYKECLQSTPSLILQKKKMLKVQYCKNVLTIWKRIYEANPKGIPGKKPLEKLREKISKFVYGRKSTRGEGGEVWDGQNLSTWLINSP